MKPSKGLDAGISRRGFLAGVTVSSALLLAGADRASASDALTAGYGSTSRYPLYVPPTVGLGNAYNLNAAPATVELGGGNLSRAWAYNGTLPGPTFRARPGDTALITLSNQLPEETITHWHGMVVNHENDGHPVYAIPPGGTYNYSFVVNQRAALNWYHPHPHRLTGEQVALGLAGAFIINDAEEDSLGLPGGVYEIPLIVRDASLDSAGNLQYDPHRSDSWGGEDITLVNGTRDPYLDVDTALYRFRVLCGANARVFGLALNNGAPFTLIGNDGGLLASAVQVGQIDVAPAERVDVLVDFRGLPVGSRVMLRDLRADGDLLEFRVTRQVSDPTPVPTALSTIARLTNPVRTRTFSFDGRSRINDQEYDVNRIDFQVPFGDVERWRFESSWTAPHPVHVHGTSFQVVSRTGGRGRLFPWESGWKDMVLLENRETAEILIQFTGFRGEYLLHCHRLEHEDNGMMSNFVVV